MRGPEEEKRIKLITLQFCGYKEVLPIHGSPQHRTEPGTIMTLTKTLKHLGELIECNTCITVSRETPWLSLYLP